MKKIKLTGKLTLNKETISRLNNQQMGAIHGGSAGDDACYATEAAGCASNDGVSDCASGNPDCNGGTSNPCESGGSIKDYTCCAGSWNHSSCGGHVCNGTITTNPN